MHNKYEISSETIKDVINKVPPDRWDDCLDELKSVFDHLAAVIGVINEGAQTLGVTAADVAGIKSTITWIDDGRREHTTRLRNGGEVADIKITTRD